MRTSNLFRILTILCLLELVVIPPLVAGTLTMAEAFFDDPSVVPGNGIPLMMTNDGSLRLTKDTIHINGLETGPHTLYTRFKDNNGEWSQAVGQTIYITPGNPDEPFLGGENRIVSAEAFIDNDPGEGKGIRLNVAEDGSIDSSLERLSGKLAMYGLKAGIHAWHTRFLDRTGTWSSIVSTSFYVPSTISSKSSSFWLMVLPAILGNK